MGSTPGRRRAAPSSSQRLVDELAQLAAQRVGARRQQLGEEMGGDALEWVDPERGAGGAAPGELALAGQDLGRRGVFEHAEPEPEALPHELRLGERADRPRELLELRAAGQVVA